LPKYTLGSLLIGIGLTIGVIASCRPIEHGGLMWSYLAVSLILMAIGDFLLYSERRSVLEEWGWWAPIEEEEVEELEGQSEIKEG